MRLEEITLFNNQYSRTQTDLYKYALKDAESVRNKTLDNQPKKSQTILESNGLFEKFPSKNYILFLLIKNVHQQQ